MRLRPAVALLALAACSEPPPPPPPPPTPAQRLDKSVERLRRLAEEQLAAAPNDARLQLWVAAFKGQDLASLPPSPLAAVLRASAKPGDENAVKEVDAALPGSSHAALFRAGLHLAQARSSPDYWKKATEAVEEALKRDAWDCPVTDFQRWTLDWLEANEPDPLARVCYRPLHMNLSLFAARDLLGVAEGMAFAAGAPRLDAPRVARALRRLLEDRIRRTSDPHLFIIASALHPSALEAQFLIAWRLKDLETARDASLAVEDFGKRAAAHASWVAGLNSKLSLEDTIEALFKNGALKPPFPGPTPPAAGEDMAENLRELQRGAPAYFAALKAERARKTPIHDLLETKRPAQSPKRNLLGQALRDREFLFSDAFPKDAYERLLDASFPGEFADPGAVGARAYGWVVRENLARPATIPSQELRRAAKDLPLDLYAVLRARKEEVDRRPPLDPSRLHGYTWLLFDAAKAKSPEAVEFLPDVLLPTPLAVAVAETLRAATEKDFGLDWERWKAALKP